MGPLSELPVRFKGPLPLDVALAELAARQHGVVTLGQLRALGLGDRAAQARAARGRLHRLHRGVYAVGHSQLTADGHRLAAVLACGPDAVLSHRSAADVYGLRRSGRAKTDVTTPHRGRKPPEGVELHRVRSLSRHDVTRRDGIPITTVARTLVDLADVLSPPALERALHEAEVLRVLDVRSVRRVLARANGRRGTARLRAALTEPSPGPTRSELEERFLTLVRAAGLPTPALNRFVSLAGCLVEVDALWARERVVVELDGERIHRTRRAFHTDRARDLALAGDGYVVVRLTWRQVAREGARVVDELRRPLALRREV